MTLAQVAEQETGGMHAVANSGPQALVAVRPPTPEEIDESLAEYDTANRMLRAAKEVLDTHKARLVFLAEHFGAVPPHAEASKRLQGRLHTLTVTWGTSYAVNDAAVLDLALQLEHVGRSDIFRGLFTAHTKHKLVEGAAEFLRLAALPKRLHQKMLAMFGQCIAVETNAPSVKVELRKPEKTAKKEGK